MATFYSIRRKEIKARQGEGRCAVDVAPIDARNKLKEVEIERKIRRLYIAPLFLFITSFFIDGCSGDKVEAPPPKPAENQISEAAPAPQQPEVVKEPQKEVEETAAVVENSRPEVLSIKLSPKLVYPGTNIKAEVQGYDKDGDAVTFSYEWKKNGNIIAHQVIDELSTDGFKKNDLVTLFVTPSDGKERGKTKWSPTIMIANRPPEITSMPSTTISNGKYIYEVKAADPDNDMLTFSLEEAPSGMTIDPETGVVRWDIPPEAKGTHNIRIAATDGDAKAFQIFTLTPKIETK